MASQQTIDLLHADSPVSVTKNITIPTLLVQGEQDTLFGLDQADANARQITQAGGRVKVIWYAGGHDGGQPDADLRAQIGQFFSYHLAHQGTDPGASFQYAVQGSLNDNGEPSIRTVTATGYPGLTGAGTQRQSLPLSGPAQGVINPAGGSPSKRVANNSTCAPWASSPRTTSWTCTELPFLPKTGTPGSAQT